MTKKRKGPERGAAPKNRLETPPRREQASNETGESAPQATTLARTYLPESFLVLLLCMTPVALMPIYYGLAVRQASQANDLEKAESDSEKARTWFILSVCFGVVINLTLVGIYLISKKD